MDKKSKSKVRGSDRGAYSKNDQKETGTSPGIDEFSWRLEDDEILRDENVEPSINKWQEVPDLDEVPFGREEVYFPWDDIPDPAEDRKRTQVSHPKLSRPALTPPPMHLPRKEADHFNIQLPVYAVWMSWCLCAAAWILGVAPFEWYGVPELFYFWGIGGMLTAIAHFARVTDWD